MLSAALGLAPALTGCAAWNAWFGDSRDDLTYLSGAMEADARQREALWKQLQGQAPSDQTTLRRALLRSLPGHSGSDTLQAQADLRALLASKPPYGIAAVARERLAELRATRECLVENEELHKRLSQVVDIERQLDRRPSQGTRP